MVQSGPIFAQSQTGVDENGADDPRLWRALLPQKADVCQPDVDVQIGREIAAFGAAYSVAKTGVLAPHLARGKSLEAGFSFGVFMNF